MGTGAYAADAYGCHYSIPRSTVRVTKPIAVPNSQRFRRCVRGGVLALRSTERLTPIVIARRSVDLSGLLPVCRRSAAGLLSACWLPLPLPLRRPTRLLWIDTPSVDNSLAIRLNSHDSTCFVFQPDDGIARFTPGFPDLSTTYPGLACTSIRHARRIRPNVLKHINEGVDTNELAKYTCDHRR